MDSTSPACEEPKKHVVIVGGGYIGNMQAYYLSQDYRVTIVEERGEVATETSYMNGGLLCPALSYPWTNMGAFKIFVHGVFNPASSTIRLRPRALLDSSFWTWMSYFFVNLPASKVLKNYKDSYKLCEYSYNLMTEDLVPFQRYRRQSKGSLQLFSTRSNLENTYDTMKRGIGETLGCQIEKLSAEECMELAPGLRETGKVGGVFAPNDSSGDIHAFTMAIKEKNEKLRVNYIFGTRINKIIFDNNQNRVTGLRTADGSVIEGDEFVIASGNGAETLARQAGDQLLSYPIKGYVFEIPVVSHAPAINVNVSDDIAKIYISPLAPKEGETKRVVRLSGMAEFAGGLDVEVRREDALKLLNAALNFFSGDYLAVNYDGTATGKEEITIRSCCRPQTPDDLPVIGQSFRYKNLWYNAGHGHIGWTRGAGSAKLLSDLMTNNSPAIDPEPYKPERFLPQATRLKVKLEERRKLARQERKHD